MKYDIAVVMATFRRPALLRRCLECLAHQTLPMDRYQVIVISDGPDDETRNTVDMCRLLYPQLNIGFDNTAQNEGPASARNKGWKLADATFIAFTDDDCLPEKTWLQRFLDSAQESEMNRVMTGSVVVPVSPVPTDYEKNISALETADFVTANCCCPKILLETVGGFDTTYKMAWREDSDLHFNFLRHAIPVEKAPAAVVIHPVRKAPWGISLKEQRKSMYNALLFKKYPAYYRLLISKGPVWKYYLMVISFICGCVALATKNAVGASILLSWWLGWVLYFSWLRLRGTSKSAKHVCEMLVTSMVIPFTSIYWTLYGSIKYKVFFL